MPSQRKAPEWQRERADAGEVRSPDRNPCPPPLVPQTVLCSSHSHEPSLPGSGAGAAEVPGVCRGGAFTASGAGGGEQKALALLPASLPPFLPPSLPSRGRGPPANPCRVAPATTQSASHTPGSAHVPPASTPALFSSLSSGHLVVGNLVAGL